MSERTEFGIGCYSNRQEDNDWGRQVVNMRNQLISTKFYNFCNNELDFCIIFQLSSYQLCIEFTHIQVQHIKYFVIIISVCLQVFYVAALIEQATIIEDYLGFQKDLANIQYFDVGGTGNFVIVTKPTRWFSEHKLNRCRNF